MTGYVSAIGGEHVLEAMTDSTEYDPIDVSYFFPEAEGPTCVNPIMYPDKATMERCSMMHDTDTEALLKMWSRVKGANASAFTYIIIVLVLGSLILALILKYYRKLNRKKKYHKKKQK